MSPGWIIFLAALVALAAASRNLEASDAQLSRPVLHTTSGVALPSTWDVLAPFPAGTREFGADPLEAFGGIRQIYARRSSRDLFPSELVFGGYVSWQALSGGNNPVNIQWNSSYVNWPLIEGWGGLTSSQFSGWAVGKLLVATSGTYTVTCSGVSTFYIDDKPFRGDVYGLGYGVFSVELTVGVSSTIFVPFGGMENAGFQCGFSDVPSGATLLALQDNVVPDIVTYRDEQIVAGGYFGFSVLNLFNSPRSRIEVQTSSFRIIAQDYTSLYPNQAGIVNVQVDPTGPSPKCDPRTNSTQARFSLLASGDSSPLYLNVTFTCRSWGLPYAFTFRDADQSVQYAAIRPPKFSCSNLQNGCPVLFTFHGAGVYARKDAWVYAYVQQPQSWILFPTNRRQFGFDWEGPGRVNAWKAFNAALRLPGVPQSLKSSYLIDQYKIQYAGHSMGGHGCWLISTHAPDRALSVSPAAGWIKMGMYIPFFTRVGDSLVDPFLSQLLMSSINMHNTDFYMRNLKGIPLMVRMGALDNNVPPFHLKRMARLHNELSHNATLTVVSEIPGESHWWGGVVDDAAMQAFFSQHWSATTLPRLPNSFTVSALSPIDFESRGGIKLLQFELSGRAAHVHVSSSSSAQWNLATINLKRFSFISMPTLSRPLSVMVDGQLFDQVPSLPSHFCKQTTGIWGLCITDTWIQSEKSPERYGPIAQILENVLSIVVGTSEPAFSTVYHDQAQMLANTLYYQGRYTPQIFTDNQVVANRSVLPKGSNVIVLGGPLSNSFAKSVLPSWSPAVHWLANGQRGFSIGSRTFTHPVSGLAFVTPTESSGLALFIDGNSPASARQATGLVPTKSSWTVPDWVVTGPEYGWNGAAGLLGAGYWNNEWQFDAATSWVSPFDEW